MFERVLSMSMLVIASVVGTEKMSSSYSDSLKLASITIETPEEKRTFLIEPWGYQQNPTWVASTRPITLHWSKYQIGRRVEGADITTSFRIENSRDPNQLLLITHYNFITLKTEDNPKSGRLNKDKGLSRNVDRNGDFQEKMNLSRLQLELMVAAGGRFTFVIDIELIGNAEEEITPIGSFIDEEMAYYGRQTFSIQIPVNVIR